MNIFVMTRYEIKKVLGKTGGKIALLVLLITLAVGCFCAMNVGFVNEQGGTEKGAAAVANLRAAQKEWAGYLDEEKLEAACRENARINATPEGQADGSDAESLRLSEIAYSQKQGFAPIRNLMNKSFAENFQSYNYYTADSLKPEQMKDFYPNRIRLLKEYLYENEEVLKNGLYSDEEKAFFVQQYEDLATPFYFDWFKGWERARDFAPSVIIMLMVVLSYLVAGIFPDEFRRRTDAVFFTSANGRGRAVAAKVLAGVAIITVIYWLTVGIFTAVTLLYFGADGGSCPVQMYSGGWKSIYNITIAQSYLMALGSGYLGCLVIGLLVMLISSLARSAVVAGLLPFAVFFAPSILGEIASKTVQQAVVLFPHMLLTFDDALGIFCVFSIGGKTVGLIYVLPLLYVVISLALMPVLYLEYRRKQLV